MTLSIVHVSLKISGAPEPVYFVLKKELLSLNKWHPGDYRTILKRINFLYLYFSLFKVKFEQ